MYSPPRESSDVVPAVGVTTGTSFSTSVSMTADMVMLVGPMTPLTFSTLTRRLVADTDASGEASVSPWTTVRLRPPMPPSALISSTIMLTTGRTFAPTHA